MLMCMTGFDEKMCSACCTTKLKARHLQDGDVALVI